MHFNLDLLWLHREGGGCFFSRKFSPALYDEPLCKFLLCTYEDSHNLFWSKKLSRGQIEYIYVALAVKNDFKHCNFVKNYLFLRVLLGYLEEFFKGFAFMQICSKLLIERMLFYNFFVRPLCVLKRRGGGFRPPPMFCLPKNMPM